MTSRRSLVLCAAFACLAASSGCARFSGGGCNRPQLYAQAQSLPPLRIPLGLDAPDTRNALKIPELNEPEAPRAPGDPCLDEPPRYATPAPAAPASPAPPPPR